MADTTAHGATLALGTSSWSQSIVAITPREQTRDSLDTTHLGTSGDFMTSKPADLADPGGVDWEYVADSLSADWEFPVNTVAETLTITLPEQNDAGDPPTLVATGFADSWTPPVLQTSVLMRGNAGFKFDGETGPTWTEDATS